MDSPNFTENLVLYIGLPAEGRGRILNAHGQKDLAGEMNRNTMSPTAASRSLHKITVTGGPESSQAALKKLGPRSKNTNNNNNTAATTQQSRTVEDVREKKPSYHSKTSMIKSQTTEIELFKWSSPHCNHKEVSRVSKFFSVPKNSCFTQKNALFNMEILKDREQAEQGSGKGRWTSQKRNSYLGMMSLFGPVSSHLWPVEMKPSRSSSHIISLL